MQSSQYMYNNPERLATSGRILIRTNYIHKLTHKNIPA